LQSVQTFGRQLNFQVIHNDMQRDEHGESLQLFLRTDRLEGFAIRVKAKVEPEVPSFQFDIISVSDPLFTPVRIRPADVQVYKYGNMTASNWSSFETTDLLEIYRFSLY
jgi:hypothetical protein